MTNGTWFKKCFIALILIPAWWIGSAQAATIEVTTGTDQVQNGCTFRNAIKAINTGSLEGTNCRNSSGNGFRTDDTIQFSILSNILLDSGQISVQDNSGTPSLGQVKLSINPGGKRVSIRRRAGSSKEFRIFEIKNSTVSFDNVTISGGRTNSSGGGLFIGESSNVSLTNSTVSDNSAGNGGGLSSQNSILRVMNSIIENNFATTGGGLENLTDDDFSGVSAATIIRNSKIQNNSALSLGGGMITVNGVTNLINTTVSDNSAVGSGGGLSNDNSEVNIVASTIARNSANFGGGFISVNDNSSVTLVNSTISSNSADFGGGFFISEGMVETILINSTVTNNLATRDSSDDGDAIFSTNGDLRITQSIVAGNASSSKSEISLSDSTKLTAENSLFGSVNDLNLSDNPSNNNIEVDFDIVELSSVLLALSDNGGPTLTHALPIGSPAIGRADVAVCRSFVNNRDQRGQTRAGSTCDIGAYEVPDDASFFVVPLSDGKSVIFEL